MPHVTISFLRLGIVCISIWCASDSSRGSISAPHFIVILLEHICFCFSVNMLNQSQFSPYVRGIQNSGPKAPISYQLHSSPILPPQVPPPLNGGYDIICLKVRQSPLTSSTWHLTLAYSRLPHPYHPPSHEDFFHPSLD